MARLGFLIILIAACANPRPSPNEERNAAARALTRQYAGSRLAEWNVRASVAGRDCRVLFVKTAVVMDDAMVEALHYGGGAYDVIDRAGLQRFCRRHAFRGVVYRDSTEHRVWTYDDVTPDDVSTPRRCD